MRGHEILQKTRDLIEDRGYKVIYGDTDSVFVLMDAVSGDVDAAASELAVYLNDWWTTELQEAYRIESYLEIEFETHFTKFLMPTVRGSEKGSKKRYAGMVGGPDGRDQLVFKGLETVRSDWTPLAKEFQQELYRRVFLDEPVHPYITEMVAAVINGGVDEKLTLRRRLRRKLVDYTKNVPPHVSAARMADAERVQRGLSPAYEQGGWIEYRMTMSGPEPIAYSTSPIDYDFYIEKQLAPIADAVLGFQNTSLAKIIDKQLGLF
jgi:DNA polymerase-2